MLVVVLAPGWIFLGISEGLCNWFPRTFGVDIFRSHWGKLAPLVEGGLRVGMALRWRRHNQYVLQAYGARITADLLATVGFGVR